MAKPSLQEVISWRQKIQSIADDFSSQLVDHPDAAVGWIIYVLEGIDNDLPEEGSALILQTLRYEISKRLSSGRW